MANDNLRQARAERRDEFYTELPEIRTELSNYADKFQGKVVYCNCDDVFESNFVKYFLMNFNRLGLKELIATGYVTSPVRGTELSLIDSAYVLRITDTKRYLIGTQKDLDVVRAKYFLLTEKDSLTTCLIGNVAHDENGDPIQISVKEKYVDTNGKEKTRAVKQELYYEAGDFRSDMSIELLKEADIVVTNPPFSLFREYVAQLMKYNKQFLILGSMNAITYKEFFPLLMDNKVWIGCSSGSKEYITTEEYAKKNPQKAYRRGGKWYTKLGNTCWFTNLDHAKRHQMIPLDLGYTYYGHEDMYPKYDNYDAINVDKVTQIPCDYEPCWFKCPRASSCRYAQTKGREDSSLCEQACNGVIGVPISLLDVFCPEQFSIVGMGCGWNGSSPLIIQKYPAQQTQHTYKNGSFTKKIVGKLNDGTPLIKIPVALTNKTYYEANGELFVRTYGRILICRKDIIHHDQDR